VPRYSAIIILTKITIRDMKNYQFSEGNGGLKLSSVDTSQEKYHLSFQNINIPSIPSCLWLNAYIYNVTEQIIVMRFFT
jgi:hypothetical protein